MRSIKAKRLKKRYWIIIIVLVGLLGAVFIGKHYHDVQVEKARLAYQKQVEQAKKAQEIAYQTRKANDIQNAQNLIKSLQSKDKEPLKQKMSQLDTYLLKIANATQAVAQATKTITPENVKKAEQEVALLTSTYEIEDKAKLQQQLEADKKVLAEREQETKRMAEEKKKLAGQKLIALTFDDGPNPTTTSQLLKILSDAKVSVTFFALGMEAQSYPELIKQESEQGHEVASHTWDHKDLVTLSPAQQKQEIESAQQLINNLTGKNVQLFRPPYGSYNASVLQQTSLTAVNWSIDTNDWRYNTSAPVVQNALANAHDGAIILMHDIHPWSVGAVPQIIQELKKQGYTFVTVSQLMEAKGVTNQAHQVYFGK